MTKLQRWRLDLSYDGTDFHGWAAQDGLRTVQGELEHWINTVLRTGAHWPLTVAGRTDAGVHARGQVAHIDLPVDIDASQLGFRLGRVLPEDLIVRNCRVAPDGFDARFAAIWRRYCYRIWDASSRPDPIRRNDVTPVREQLDVAAMHAAGQQLLGLQDFVAFCKYREGATTIRQLTELSVVRADDAAGSIEITVQADAFCHSMVRSLVGALVAVGSGQRDLDWLTGLLARQQRSGEIHVMLARGLTLEAVGYPPDDQLAIRAHQARARREPSELNPQQQ